MTVVSMADNPSPPKKHWALLVGLDYYRHEKCLEGCVRDVLTVKEYLEAGPDSIDITMLTATTPPEASLKASLKASGLPLEDPCSWPTWSNLIEKLKRVMKFAQKGDFVYIHYSGHGSREKSSNKPACHSGNLALALFEDNQHGISYFKGETLASCLKKMVKQGLLVTVVLDCCFSGSVLRTGNVRGVGIRSIDYDPAIEAATAPEHKDYFSSRDVEYPLRDSTLRDQWLVNPDGYTILSACGPHETAYELELPSGERRGALSCFLMESLSALRKRGVDITHESLYEHLRIRFHASWPCQTPMRYGNKSFSFFDSSLTASSMPFINVYANGNSLCLDAGEAHGVYTGDTYTLHPPEWLGDVVSQVDSTSVTARVDAVRCLTSDLVDIKPATARKEMGTGWRAKLITSLSQRKISVRLPASIYDPAHQATTSEDQRYLRFCTSNDDREACMFNVAFDGQGSYVILDGLGETIANLPTIPANAQGANQLLMDTLQHLAKFKYAEGIENQIPDTAFETRFSLASSIGGRELGSSSVFDVEHGGTWQLEIENKGETALYFTLFNFTPSWKIHNLLSESGHNGFWVMEPKSKEILPLMMEVPEFLQSKGTGCCEDTIKVFITSRAASFPSMVLPELPLYAPYHRGQPHEAGDGLLSLTTGLIGSARDHDAGHEKWATRSFVIRTKMG
ncbi:caspase domain-containing protein [Trichoderma austrokoningii]